MHSRRAALVTLAAGTVSPLLAQHVGHDLEDGASPPQPRDPSFFNKPDYAVVTRVADLIIPRTDTPGAVDANVPYRIDHQVSAHAELQIVFHDGLTALSDAAHKLGATDFVSLSQVQQITLLTAISAAPDTAAGRFFQAIKEITVDWYYRSEEGLVTELGFKGNTFRPNFPGCTHPEHWPSDAAQRETR